MRTPIGSEPEKATMQLLHQTWRSRMERLNVAAVVGPCSGKYGNQQRFSASTSSPMSSVRQNRYALISAYAQVRSGESQVRYHAGREVQQRSRFSFFSRK